MFQNILVVCTGNICRSPYAQYSLAALVPSASVTSAGLSALVDHGADDLGIKVALQRDIDMRQHRARQVRASIISASDLILTMEDNQLREILKRFPEARGKTFKLGKWQENKNIVDPYQKPETFFKLVFDEIDVAVGAWVKYLA